MKRPSKAKAMERLQKAREAITELRSPDILLGKRSSSPEFKKWRRNTEIAITNIFGKESRNIEDFKDVRYQLGPISSLTSQNEFMQAYLQGLGSANAVLESMLEEIEEYWEDDIETLTPPTSNKISRPDTNKVFVIHGRDEGTREMVAGFLRQLELEPLILSEQSSQGRTIIEKFEQYAEVGFAIALLTPDDTGSLKGEGNKPNPRARQNVIFELGCFIGKLGRERVCALTKGEVEIPSDYSGVVYIPLDDPDGWKLPLFRELKAAGYDVDANRIV